MAIQYRWDRLREAIVARAAGDYKRMMATGVVCMKLKSMRGKNNVQRVYREYEIDTGVIEALNSGGAQGSDRDWPGAGERLNHWQYKR
jgi:hypothetical protein